MVSTIPLVDTITPRPDPLQATPHPEQAPFAVRLLVGGVQEELIFRVKAWRILA